jgi:GT2 family glycosyltransferase
MMKSIQSEPVKLSIIIVNYNGSDFIVNCLSSIFSGVDTTFEVVIVDNASTDFSANMISEFIKNNDRNSLKFIRLEKNIGFAGASNLGAKNSSGWYLLFLNPDTGILSGSADDMIEFYSSMEADLKIGAMGIKIFNQDMGLQYSSRAFLTLGRQFYESFFLDKIFVKTKTFGAYFMKWWDHSDTMQVDWVSGAAMLLSREKFIGSGLFDPDYFMYSEDADLCLRLSRNGYRNYYYPFFCVMHHDAGIASCDQPLRNVQIWRSRRIYFAKNYSRVHAGIFSTLYLFFVLNRISLFFVLSCFFMINSGFKIRAKQYLKTLRMYFTMSNK